MNRMNHNQTMTNQSKTDTMSPSSSSSSNKSLPQPRCGESSYTYRKWDEFSSSLQSQLPTLPPDTPCRLLLSKGKNKAAQLSPYTVSLLKVKEEEEQQQQNDDDDAGMNDKKEKNESNNSPTVKYNENERLTVRYPKGSTYDVKMKNILPITQEKQLIIVAPETKYYRKLCIVQTPHDHSFIEIGCDFALTTGNVDCIKRLGIDKSPTSLEIAHGNFPDLPLEEVDILEESEENLMNLLERYEMNHDRNKLIVGIDINGNREYEAVRDCLQRVLDLWQPRLIIVKSRSMFRVMLEQEDIKI